MHILIMMALSHFLLQENVAALECIIPSSDRTRSFKSLIRYQGNQIPFNPNLPLWQGSSVEFEFTTINRLPRNVFVAYTSGNVIKLNLSGKQVTEVEDGAFYSLQCLHVLRLDRNNITRLSGDMFQDMNHLEVLDLSENQIRELPDLVFNNTPGLKVLNLAKNKIRTLQLLCFQGLSNLNDLNLEFNLLRNIPPAVFISANSLKDLNLAFNKMTDIEPEKWLYLSRLEKLNLAGNDLYRFDPGYNFSFSGLTVLNLSSNYLTQLNVLNLRRHLPQLGLVDINGNPWFCDTLSLIIHDLSDSKIHVSKKTDRNSAEEDVSCSTAPVFPFRSTSETVASSEVSSTTVAANLTYLSYLDKILGDSNRTVQNNKEILSTLNYATKLLIFLFIIVICFVVFEVVLRTNYCFLVVNLFRPREERYLRNGANENYGLLRT